MGLGEGSSSKNEAPSYNSPSGNDAESGQRLTQMEVAQRTIDLRQRKGSSLVLKIVLWRYLRLREDRRKDDVGALKYCQRIRTGILMSAEGVLTTYLVQKANLADRYLMLLKTR